MRQPFDSLKHPSFRRCELAEPKSNTEHPKGGMGSDPRSSDHEVC